MTRARTFRASAFTLVDVMMAATILVMAFIGMIEAVTLTATRLDHARRQTYANQIINHEIEKLRYATWTTISGLPTTSTSLAIDPLYWPTWNSATRYAVNSVITYNGVWYRCSTANHNVVPPNGTYWTVVTTGQTTDIISTLGAPFTLARTLTNPDPVTNIREVNFTVTWVVKTSRRDSGGNPLSFTYTLQNSAWFGKYGLNLSYQRS